MTRDRNTDIALQQQAPSEAALVHYVEQRTAASLLNLYYSTYSSPRGRLVGGGTKKTVVQARAARHPSALRSGDAVAAAAGPLH